MKQSAPPLAPHSDRDTADARLRQVLGYQVAQASISTVAAFHQLVGRECELRPVEYTLLALIHEDPEHSLVRLAQALAVTAPNITMWIDRLEARKLVKRMNSPTDRRAFQLRLTPKGARLAKDATSRLVEGEAKLYSDLSPEERQQLLGLLQKVAAKRSFVSA
jgi:DNA-binding MarR family transcriptional regulator